jgi:hypothetical protein
MSMEVFTSWTSYVFDVASASSGGWQPPKYGQVAALFDWPLKALTAPGVYTPLLAGLGAECAACCGRGATLEVRAAALLAA